MIDEPFTPGGDWIPMPAQNLPKLVDRIRKINDVVVVLKLIDFQPVSQKPDLSPLQIPHVPGHRVHQRQIRYLQERRANARQMYDARKELYRTWDLADYVNLQRALECQWFQPARSWHYYPIIDRINGTGVPRPIEFMGMLTYPAYCIQISNKLYEYCTHQRAIRPLDLE